MNTSLYEHTQPGTLLRYSFGATMLLLGGGVLLFGAITGDPDALWISAITVLVMIIVLLLFHSLTVRVSPDDVVLSFGVGLIRKRFTVTDIQRSSVVQNRWFYGWGIRLTPHGWLYNVSGWDAVEIEFQNGRKTRIGTDDATGLHSAIEAAAKAG